MKDVNIFLAISIMANLGHLSTHSWSLVFITFSLVNVRFYLPGQPSQALGENINISLDVLRKAFWATSLIPMHSYSGGGGIAAVRAFIFPRNISTPNSCRATSPKL
jgi:hypothetical protein